MASPLLNFFEEYSTLLKEYWSRKYAPTPIDNRIEGYLPQYEAKEIFTSSTEKRQRFSKFLRERFSLNYSPDDVIHRWEEVGREISLKLSQEKESELLEYVEAQLSKKGRGLEGKPEIWFSPSSKSKFLKKVEVSITSTEILEKEEFFSKELFSKHLYTSSVTYEDDWIGKRETDPVPVHFSISLKKKAPVFYPIVKFRVEESQYLIVLKKGIELKPLGKMEYIWRGKPSLSKEKAKREMEEMKALLKNGVYIFDRKALYEAFQRGEYYFPPTDDDFAEWEDLTPLLKKKEGATPQRIEEELTKFFESLPASLEVEREIIKKAKELNALELDEGTKIETPYFTLEVGEEGYLYVEWGEPVKSFFEKVEANIGLFGASTKAEEFRTKIKGKKMIELFSDEEVRKIAREYRKEELEENQKRMQETEKEIFEIKEELKKDVDYKEVELKKYREKYIEIYTKVKKGVKKEQMGIAIGKQGVRVKTLSKIFKERIVVKEGSEYINLDDKRKLRELENDKGEVEYILRDEYNKEIKDWKKRRLTELFENLEKYQKEKDMLVEKLKGLEG